LIRSRISGCAALLAHLLLAAGCAAAQSPVPVDRPFHVIAHRGASAEAPENTLPAFARALELGALEVELDVQLSRDGVPILFHDGSLDAKTPLRGRLRDHPAEALTRADIGSWFDRAHPGGVRPWAGTPLTTLEALFERFGSQLRYHIELKDDLDATPGRVIGLVKAAGLEGFVTLTSFHRVQLDRAQRAAPQIPLCWLLKGAGPERIDEAARSGFAMVGVDAAELTEALVRRAHERGLAIRAYSVETDAEIERVFATGSDGLTIDDPRRVLARAAAR
jgi:glycerophosphoryl diester phosphodiesterase